MAARIANRPQRRKLVLKWRKSLSWSLPGQPGYVGRLLRGIGISDPGGSTPAPPPPAAHAEENSAVADGGEIGSTSAIKTRLPIGIEPPQRLIHTSANDNEALAIAA